MFVKLHLAHLRVVVAIYSTFGPLANRSNSLISFISGSESSSSDSFFFFFRPLFFRLSSPELSFFLLRPRVTPVYNQNSMYCYSNKTTSQCAIFF